MNANTNADQLKAMAAIVKTVLPSITRLADNKPTYRLAVLCADVIFDLLNDNTQAATRHFVVFSREFVEFVQGAK